MTTRKRTPFRKLCRQFAWLAILSLFLFQGLNSWVSAQPLGSPVLTNSHRQFTLSFNGGYTRKPIFGVGNRSTRFLLKGVLGFGRRFDVFADLGVVKLTLEKSGSTPSKLADKYRLAYGAGFALRYLNIQRWRLAFFLNAQAFRFTCQPTMETTLSIPGGEIVQILQLRYDWREALLHTGLVKDVGVVKFIAGVKVNFIQRLETKISATRVGGSPGPEEIEKGRYQSGLQTHPIAGLEFTLPSRYVLSFELSGRDRSDFAFNFGISQTGKP